MPDVPEPMESLQARFPAVLARLWDIDSPDYDVDRGPGKYREHVMDTENGFRFIVSREKYSLVNDGVPNLHVSVSLREDSEIGKIVAACKSQQDARETYLRLIRDTFGELSGIELPEQPTHVTAGGVLHWTLADVVPE